VENVGKLWKSLWKMIVEKGEFSTGVASRLERRLPARVPAPHLTGAVCYESGQRKGMRTLTDEQVEANLRAVAHAVAQQELEGLTVPEWVVADLRRAARGEIETDEVIRNIHRRLDMRPCEFVLSV